MDFSILDQPLPETEKIPLIEINDDGTQVDPRFQFLSYSSLQILHSCPRKFQLSRLKAKHKEDANTNITFAFGHAVGDGIAELLLTRDLDAAIWKAFKSWDAGFDAANEKQQKSIPFAILALEIFNSLLQENNEFQDLEVMHWHGIPAIELGFRIDIPGTLSTYKFRGFIDLVMRNSMSGKITVIENKTSSGNYVNHYSYKNSSQALGYSAILDTIDPSSSSYEVLYNIYMTKLKRYEIFPFIKNKTQKAHWIQSLIHDIAQIEYFIGAVGNYGHWPMRGESCTEFGRVCEFMDVCQLDTSRLISPPTVTDAVDSAEVQFEFNIEDLLK